MDIYQKSLFCTCQSVIANGRVIGHVRYHLCDLHGIHAEVNMKRIAMTAAAHDQDAPRFEDLIVEPTKGGRDK